MENVPDSEAEKRKTDLAERLHGALVAHTRTIDAFRDLVQSLAPTAADLDKPERVAEIFAQKLLDRFSLEGELAEGKRSEFRAVFERFSDAFASPGSATNSGAEGTERADTEARVQSAASDLIDCFVSRSRGAAFVYEYFSFISRAPRLPILCEIGRAHV